MAKVPSARRAQRPTPPPAPAAMHDEGLTRRVPVPHQFFRELGDYLRTCPPDINDGFKHTLIQRCDELAKE